MMPQYAISESDRWQWAPALGTDVADIVKMSIENYGREVEQVFGIDPHRAAYNLTDSVVRQLYLPGEAFVICARDKSTGELMAFAWAKRHGSMEFSADELSEMRYTLFNDKLSVRTRVTMMAQILDIWAQWAWANGVKVLTNSSLRDDQAGYLSLHRECGFSVRGSFCCMRLEWNEPEPSGLISPTGEPLVREAR